jgi:hypothetical protein
MADLGMDGKIMLQWFYTNKAVRCGLDSYGSEYGPILRCYMRGEEFSGFVTDGEFIECG